MIYNIKKIKKYIFNDNEIECKQWNIQNDVINWLKWKKFLYIMERQIQQNREYKVIMYVCTWKCLMYSNQKNIIIYSYLLKDQNRKVTIF